MKFNHPFISETVTKKLEVGDYGVEFEDGVVPLFYFERKSIGDLFGTMGGGYKRFKKEMVRARDMGATLFLLIEGTLSDVLNGYKHSSIDGNSLLQKLFTLWTRYGLIPIFCSSRSECSRFITEFFLSVGREKVRAENE